MNENLSKNIKKLLEHYQLTPSQLARETGIQQPVIHRIAAGETANPKIATLLPIAKFFCVTIEQLLSDRPITPVIPRMFTIPMLTFQEVKAYLTAPDQFSCQHLICVDCELESNAFAVTAEDNTMWPLFPRNTALIFNPASSSQEKNFVLAQTKDKVIFRQLINHHSQPCLKPLNDDDHEPYPLQASDTILACLVQAKITYYKEHTDPNKESILMHAEVPVGQDQ